MRLILTGLLLSLIGCATFEADPTYHRPGKFFSDDFPEFALLKVQTK